MIGLLDADRGDIMGAGGPFRPDPATQPGRLPTFLRVTSMSTKRRLGGQNQDLLHPVLRRVASNNHLVLIQRPREDEWRVSDLPDDVTRAWRDLIDQLLALRDLESDWDGQGAEAPPPALVDGAIYLARCFQSEGLLPADRVTAGVNGTIFFSWHLPGSYHEIEVISPGEAEVREVADGSDEAEESSLVW